MNKEVFGPHDHFLQGFAFAAALSMLAAGSVLAGSYAVAVFAWLTIGVVFALAVVSYLMLRAAHFRRLGAGKD